MGRLAKALWDNHASDVYPLHMPGHKRNILDFEKGDALDQIRGIDLTEVDGFDDLHCPTGMINELMERAAALFGAEESSVMVNGSTGGILAAISACTQSGDKIILARNSHKSAYNAVMINGLSTAYVYPKIHERTGIASGVEPEAVREALCQNPDAKALFITSPTYEGVISDIAAISELAHSHNVPLIVDEAHGAHLGFNASMAREFGMESAVSKGADIVIQSLHKTLPSLTQTAIIHYRRGYIDTDRLKRFLTVYQTSSPSYVFMASMERCFDILKAHGTQLFDEYESRLKEFYKKAAELKNINVMNPKEMLSWPAVAGFDAGKLLISPRKAGLSGPQLKDILLEKYHLQPEMVSREYVIAMTSIMDSDEGFNRLLEALFQIDETGRREYNEDSSSVFEQYPRAEVRGTLRDNFGRGRSFRIEELHPGEVSNCFLYAYPPGIPIIAPGEEITAHVMTEISRYQKRGIELIIN